MLDTSRRLRPGGLAATLPQSPNERPFFIVTGTGRSGTSAVARVLHESGLSMGGHFRTPTKENLTGFYEELPVCDLNDRIMRKCGMAGLRHWPWRSTVLAVAERHSTLMDSLIPDESVAGWKDPRFSVTLEAWLPYLPRRAKVVVCLRNSEAFYHSAAQMFGLISRDLVERWWTNELRRLLAVVRDYRLEAICIEYDDLVRLPEETVERLSSFIGRPLDAAYIEPSLRHHEYPIPERHTSLYQQVRSLGTAAATGGRTQPRQRPAEASEIERYLQRIRSLDADIAAAHASWAAAAGAPNLALDDPERVRAASAAYVETLRAAQIELGSLPPPPGFAGYYEATRDVVNNHRLVAQLTLQAAEQQRPASDAAREYERRLSPQAIAASEKRRTRAYKRALKSSGYREQEPARE